MSKINVLDATLRDGGYENSWKFGRNNIYGIIQKLAESNVDYIEIGFLEKNKLDSDYTIYNSCERIKEIIPLENKKKKVAIMMKNGTYDVSSIGARTEESVDLIRVSFHEYDIIEALENMKKIKRKGYQVSCNPINFVGYSNELMIWLLKEVNKIKPDIFYVVDTFGGLMPKKFKDILALIDEYLDETISIGLHLHNNLTMALPLAISFLEWSGKKREKFIDSCVGGIGREPGNLSTELIINYINDEYERKYLPEPIYNIIDKHIKTIGGYTKVKRLAAYQLSAREMINRNYVEFFLDRYDLSLLEISRYLMRISDEQKKIFNEKYAEKLVKIMVDDKDMEAYV